MSKKFLTTLVVIGVVIAGGAFYGGMLYQKHVSGPTLANLSKLSADQRRQVLQQLAANGGFGGGGRARGGFGSSGANGTNGSGGFVNGQIIAKDDKSITVQLPNNGGTKIIFLSSSAQISKSAAGAPSDLTVGESVLVNGSANSDGSVTAQNIQIRPAQSGQTNQPQGQ